MSNTIRPSKDLQEIFGYAPDDTTAHVRQLWQLGACPFVNGPCEKHNHDQSIIYGTCSVDAPGGECIICPLRLYQNNYATLKRIVADAYGDKLELLMYNQFIKRRAAASDCIVALGHNSGKEVKLGRQLSMDWVLARIANRKLEEYVGVEVQSIDITGNYRDAWYAYKNLDPAKKTLVPASGHGLNWANVHKRLIPQIIRKGLVYSRSKLVKRGLYFIVPDIVFDRFERILGSDIGVKASVGPNTLTVHTYSLSPAPSHGRQRNLVFRRSLRIDLDEFAKRFITGPTLPPSTELDSAIKAILGCG